MIDIKNWTSEFTKKAKNIFGERIYFIGFFNIVLHPVSVRIDISETIAIIQHFLLIIHKTSC